MVQWIVVSVGAALLLNSGSGTRAFATGQYRNLFAEAGYPPKQVTLASQKRSGPVSKN